MITARAAYQRHRIEEQAAFYCRQDSEFAGWAAGYEVIAHDALTQVQVYNMVDWLLQRGVLTFAGLQHVHTPLPGECLVAFLSDGAAEEQRGADWAPRWWRAEDCGLVLPIMIANGRRIDQRTTLAMAGGVDWLRDYLRLHRFDPIDLDGRDPAAFAWVIFEMEQRLLAGSAAVAAGKVGYPVFMPYGIAETEKGYGFPGAGTNAAHGLPLETSPAVVR